MNVDTLTERAHEAAKKIELDEAGGANGLAQLVLTLVKLIHDLLEKQAIRRMEAGRLSDDELERLGVALMRQSEELMRLCDVFELELDDLELDLGSVHTFE